MNFNFYTLRSFTATVLLCFSLVEVNPVKSALASSANISSDRDLAGVRQDRTQKERLMQQGEQQFQRGEFQAALQTFQQLLSLHRTQEDTLGIAKTLNQIGKTYTNLGEYQKALEVLSEALEIYQNSDTASGLGRTLNDLGVVRRRLGEYSQALSLHQQALELARQSNDDWGVGEALHNTGVIYAIGGNYTQALEVYQQALAIRRKLGDRFDTGRTLNNIGSAYSSQGNYAQALKFYQEALAIAQEIANRASKGRLLNNIGLVYRRIGRYRRAGELHRQALAILTELSDRAGVSRTLNSLGTVSESLGEYDRALDFYKRALAISQELEDRQGESNALENIGGIHYNRSQYSQALEFYERALAIKREIGDRPGAVNTLNNLGGVYASLGQYSQARKFLQQALQSRQEVGDPDRGRTLGHLGIVDELQGEYLSALDFYRQALQIARTVEDKTGESQALELIGGAYTRLGLDAQALEFYGPARIIARQIGDRATEIRILNSIGIVHHNLGRKERALNFYQQALNQAREIEDHSGEGVTLHNIAVLNERQPELAIAFYKQSVNVRQNIRQNIKNLPQSLQQSYVATVAQTYRRLADLLLSQGRLLEAQQVLELLKVEEIQNYTQERAGEQQSEVVLLPLEATILTTYGSLIAFGQELLNCERAECKRLSELRDRRDNLAREYQQAVKTIEAAIRQRRSQDRDFFDPKHFSRLSRQIIDARSGTVLIYPLVLEDKLWLLWASQGRIFSKREINVGRQQLGETVLLFRDLLQDPYSELQQVQATSQQLYRWLIAPLEKELSFSESRYLVFALDSVTRYIPMEALFDGEEYLLEKYAITTILSAELTDTEARFPREPQQVSILGLGVSDAVAGFESLPHVETELDAVIREDVPGDRGIYPGVQFLNREFDFRTLRDRLPGRKVLHIATHAEFVPGRRDESYLVLGTGEKLPIPEIEVLADYLNDVHLVVLSACETALGGSDNNGIEIAGISYYFLNGGAKTILASLWKVNDSSTSLLMQNFYNYLSQKTGSPAEALRQAQLDLLTGDATSLTENSSQGDDDFRHPYYWAPFILIGNGL